MPKPKRTTTVPTTSRLLTAKRRKERTQQLLITGLCVFIVAVIAGLTAFGYYLSQEGPGGRKALQIGDTTFNTSYLLHRVKMELAQTPSASQPQVSTIVDTALNDIEQEEVVRQQAGSIGINVTPDEIDTAIAERLGVSKDDPTAYDDAFKNILAQTELSEKQYRAMVEGQLLRDKVSDNFKNNVPATGEQARVRLITVASQADMQNVQQRLNSGEDFGNIAKEVSLDTQTKDLGGELGWVARGVLTDEFDNAIFSLEPGQRTQPVTSAQGVTIIELEEKASDRPYEEDMRTLLGENLYSDWFDKSREIVGVTPTLDQEQVDWIIEKAFSNRG